MWKALSVIAALLAAGAAFLSYLNKNDAEQERELLATAKVNKEAIDSRFKEANLAQEEADRKFTKMLERRKIADEEAAAKMTERDEKIQEVKDAEQRNIDLEAAIKKANDEIAEIGDIGTVVAEIDTLNTQIFDAKNEIAALEQKLTSANGQKLATSSRIQSYKELESRQRTGQMKSINARIAEVYNSWGFAVLGAGDRQGVVSGTRLDVVRGGEKIAELLVTNLEPNRSVCDIVPGSMESGQMLRPGDKVSVNPASMPKPEGEAVATVPGAAPAAGGAALPIAAPAPAPEMAPAGVPEGEDDPFGFDTPSTPATPPAEPTTPAPAPEPETPATGGDDPFDF